MPMQLLHGRLVVLLVCVGILYLLLSDAACMPSFWLLALQMPWHVTLTILLGRVMHAAEQRAISQSFY